jgi:hypothetical protein
MIIREFWGGVARGNLGGLEDSSIVYTDLVCGAPLIAPLVPRWIQLLPPPPINCCTCWVFVCFRFPFFSSPCPVVLIPLLVQKYRKDRQNQLLDYDNDMPLKCWRKDEGWKVVVGWARLPKEARLASSPNQSTTDHV